MLYPLSYKRWNCLVAEGNLVSLADLMLSLNAQELGLCYALKNRLN